MLKKVLVANRGEIAVRIIRSLKKMGIASVAIYSEADRNAPHVALADEAYFIGHSPVTDSYLRIDKILNILHLTGADGVHPGYGLLSENAKFVQAVERSSAVFIGPHSESILNFGLKDQARNRAKEAGVPLVPGSDLLSSRAEAIKMANAIEYPVMLKAVAGGGGIGMQRCANEQELLKAYDSVTALAKNNFGDGGVFLEKCIDKARHIEVQIFGDGQGRVITLGERDCSLQRRNQKVVEETPAPHLSPSTREALAQASIALASQNNYRSAGTIEFIYDCNSKQFYFLEVNTRLQVEHTITEEIFDIDLVEWMLRLAGGDLSFWPDQPLSSRGHAFQARIYAEDPLRHFQPSTGEISHWTFGGDPRIDTWVDAGTTVTPYYDPLLAKVIVHGADRAEALAKLSHTLSKAIIGGVQTNTAWLASIVNSTEFMAGQITTNYTTTQHHCPPAFEVLTSGVQTTVQDYPGRVGQWDVGVPPNGPMDALSFRLGNRCLGNSSDAAGLECLLQGPKLQFFTPTAVCITGATVSIKINGQEAPMWTTLCLSQGDILEIGKISSPGCRSYICFDGGLQTPPYLRSRSTFTLGKFGGHCGRPLLAGDTLPLLAHSSGVHKTTGTTTHSEEIKNIVPLSLRPKLSREWTLRVLIGPHTSPEFFTKEDMERLLEATWKVHFNSDRTGVRLIGPQPTWAREDGGEAGLHPSNIHDNAYAIGAMDFTGDQPVLLGPDGPSLGGFVCPVTIIKADLWKMGQLSSDDTVHFLPMNFEEAQSLLQEQEKQIDLFQESSPNKSLAVHPIENKSTQSPILATSDISPTMVIRQSGDSALLCEFGAPELDLSMRIHVHFFRQQVLQVFGTDLLECTPGIRSLQVQFNCARVKRNYWIEKLIEIHRHVALESPEEFESRIIHLPLSWDDPATQVAIDKYVTNVRPNAPWCCPNNIEFIRRVNGLESIQDVKDIVYNASYLVMGLGDVYLGAPVAVPLDPRHRLVTTKYNPARTWTPENAVGIGGAYMCIYGMEGPGGYQFVGRTLPVWNRFRITPAFSEPHLLRFFDQIKFVEVSAEELLKQRSAFLAGQLEIHIESTKFKVKEYQKFLDSISTESAIFKQRQTESFEAEKQRWREQGLFSFDSNADLKSSDENVVPPGAQAIVATVSGSVWKCLAEIDDIVDNNQALVILEAMKMEMSIYAPCAGKVGMIFVKPGETVQAGQALGYVW